RVHEIADQKSAAVGRQHDGGKIRLAHERADERRQQIFHERGDNRAERRAQHNRDREIEHIPTQYELPKTSQHSVPPNPKWCRTRLITLLTMSYVATLARQRSQGVIGASIFLWRSAAARRLRKNPAKPGRHRHARKSRGTNTRCCACNWARSRHTWRATAPIWTFNCAASPSSRTKLKS